MIFRKACSYYIRTKYLPGLILPGPVEVDETKVSRQKIYWNAKKPRQRWVFGLYCRSTKIILLYYIHPVTHQRRIEFMK